MIGMSLVVRMVGHAALLPALDPTYGIPSCTRSAIARSIPLSCSSRASRNELPPPTNTASLSRQHLRRVAALVHTSHGAADRLHRGPEGRGVLVVVGQGVGHERDPRPVGQPVPQDGVHVHQQPVTRPPARVGQEHQVPSDHYWGGCGAEPVVAGGVLRGDGPGAGPTAAPTGPAASPRPGVRRRRLVRRPDRRRGVGAEVDPRRRRPGPRAPRRTRACARRRCR